MGCLQQGQCVKMPGPIELELDLDKHNFEEKVLGLFWRTYIFPRINKSYCESTILDTDRTS